MKSLRLLLIASLLFWSLGPAVAYAEEPVQQQTTTLPRQGELIVSVSPEQATNHVGQPHTFTLLLEYSGYGKAGPGYTVWYTYTDVNGVETTGSGVTGTDSTVDVPPVNSFVPGQGSLFAWCDGPKSNTALITWEEWQMEITPSAAVNPIGEAHTFTLSLLHNIGGGWHNADQGKVVNLTIDGPGYFVSVNGAAAAGQSGTGTTDANGQIIIVATSDLPGTSTLTGSYGVVNGAVTVNYTDKAEKIWRAGAIQGVVFNDVNANGVKDTGESPLAGWTVTLYAADGATVLATALSDADGAYKFDNLKPGKYYVAETLIGPEWSNTTPLKRLTEVVYNTGTNEIVAPIVDFGNEKPLLGFHEDASVTLPYTGGQYHPTLPAFVDGSKHIQPGNPLSAGSNGLLGALVMAALAIAAVMTGSAGTRKVFLI